MKQKYLELWKEKINNFTDRETFNLYIDLTDEKIHFYKKEMKINVISIGVQNFVPNS